MKIRVLDHGYVYFVEAWGHGREGLDGVMRGDIPEPDQECGIVEAARQSTQGAFRGWDQDAKLLKFLYENKHATPFEFAGMTIEVQAPIFVFREWHRHRTQSYNEASARYAPLPDLYYVPDGPETQERIQRTDANKQAQGIGRKPTQGEIYKWLGDVEQAYKRLEEIYQHALTIGIPKELARITMPVGHYSRMRASANLRNWLAFLTLRMDHRAQWEIRQYANVVHSIMQRQFPQVVCLFDNERIGVPDNV